RVNEYLDIFPILDKADVLRAGRLERRHVAKQSSRFLRAHQGRAGQSRQCVERERPGSKEKAWVGHLAPVAAEPPAPISSSAWRARRPPPAALVWRWRWGEEQGRRS